MQVQRTLVAPVASKTGCNVQPRAPQSAPALSRALARVLSATESKENDANLEHSESVTRDNTEEHGKKGKKIICVQIIKDAT